MSNTSGSAGRVVQSFLLCFEDHTCYIHTHKLRFSMLADPAQAEMGGAEDSEDIRYPCHFKRMGLGKGQACIGRHREGGKGEFRDCIPFGVTVLYVQGRRRFEGCLFVSCSLWWESVLSSGR